MNYLKNFKVDGTLKSLMQVLELKCDHMYKPLLCQKCFAEKHKDSWKLVFC